MFIRYRLPLALVGIVICSTAMTSPREDPKGDRKEPAKM